MPQAAAADPYWSGSTRNKGVIPVPAAPPVLLRLPPTYTSGQLPVPPLIKFYTIPRSESACRMFTPPHTSYSIAFLYA
jgi:hypothetical protein